MPDMRLGTRIKILRQEKGLTQSQLGACFNLAESTISLYEADKRSPDYEILCKLAHYFQVSIDYLLGHTDERRYFDFNQSNTLYDTRANAFDDDDGIPLVAVVLNTPNGLTYQIDSAAESNTTYNPAEIDLFWLQINNDSMTGDAILSKDYALIKKQAHLEYGEIGLVIVDNEPGTIYRVFKKEKSIVLQSSNPAYPPLIFAGKELSKVKIVGKVMGIRRKL